MNDENTTPEIMTNGDAFRMLQQLPQVMGLKGSTLMYAVARNESKLTSYTRKLRSKHSNPHPEEKEYEEKRVALCENFCDRGEDGEPAFEGEMYLGLEGNKDFHAEWDKLKEEYSEVLDTRKLNHEAFSDELKEDANIKLYMVDRESLPEDIDGNQTKVIRFMIRGFFDEVEDE